jgi:biopolymer transport protein ExbB
MLMWHTMGTSGALAVTSIMIGLSRALKVTVEGLLVTIPCVVMNNILQRCVNELLAQYGAQHGS